MKSEELINILIGLTILVSINEAQCGLGSSKEQVSTEAHLPGTSWYLIDIDPESMAMVGQGEFFPINKQSALPEVEKVRAEIFIFNTEKPTMNSRKTEQLLTSFSKELNELQKRGKLDEDGRELRLEVETLYSISISVKASNCNQMDAIFLDKLEAMTLKYKQFPNIYAYLNGYYSMQLKYCETLFDQQLFEAWKKKLDKRSAIESTHFSNAYEQANIIPRQNFLNKKGDDSKGEELADSFSAVRGRKRQKDLQFWTLIDATSSYLLNELPTDQLAQTGNVQVCSRIVQAQVQILDHACLAIREVFSGLARIHEILKRAKPNLEMTNFPSNDPHGPIAWLKVANHCNSARGIFYNYVDPIERAYKRKVVLQKFPEILLHNDPSGARKSWLDLKLKLYATEPLQPATGSTEARQQMSPQETQASLNQLIRFGFAANEGPNNYFFDLADDVELLDVSRVNGSRCLNGFFETFDILLGKFSQFTVNIQPYLMHFYGNQIDLCRQQFAKLVHNAVTNASRHFSQSIMEKFQRLRKAFMDDLADAQSTEIMRQIYVTNTQKFERVLANYLIDETDLASPNNDQVITLEPLRNQFDDISSQCYELTTGNLRELLDTYDRIREYSGINVPIGNDEAANWIMIGKVCQRIQFLDSFRENLGNYI